MKGVITAGGLGTRLYPLTYVTNKHLLPVYNKPMIFYPIETLVNAGIDEIMIVVGGPHVGHFLNILRNGRELGVKHLEFAYQEKEGGIAQALSLAENFADNDNVAVILGDNTTDADISKDVARFSGGAQIFLKQVPDPHRFGVPTFDLSDSSKILKITEKPKNPDSDFAVTGLYMYDSRVFDFIKNIKPSDRGELEITDVNNEYIKKGELTWSELKGYWRDAGTFDTLLEATNHWAKKQTN
ncbi:MAG: Glucose-1-phosphate thymidylyltransferase [Candidatus Daviesbacteria bacterium GW2011_GWA2_38_24]|uniref:glucose-1-phosphate thymidylyltransferase n=1 Tax=Candidatus Daviesbacteria bacterium GW2011_GWA2_38_24 TaxID=1618422 RepID=A0A0G0M0W0_9BACT|nr:MAG: Glucose-1-phosphate thymidylyltransferase [Candidatus Daviesbacteria bacterium GW2011_GWA2_38_24]KKQ79640.1 MAG: Glucose-1-phosphate thymidylyltransferase [Candidatus Daviesbacteria bacterium GW2011_GWA1_38_7]